VLRAYLHPNKAPACEHSGGPMVSAILLARADLCGRLAKLALQRPLSRADSNSRLWPEVTGRESGSAAPLILKRRYARASTDPAAVQTVSLSPDAPTIHNQKSSRWS
jgi:hypothetical protein